MTVIDWNKDDMLNYLGTYFPRSYAEAYCIYSDFFSRYLSDWQDKEELSVFDFGCGTGGEIIGLLAAICKYLSKVKHVEITALDGNQDALRLFEDIIQTYSAQTQIDVQYKIAPIVVDDFYDLSILDSVITRTYDIIMSFKAICEFVSKDQFEKQNAYEHVVRFLLPKLKDNGIMLLVDVTTYSNVSQEWLPTTMDKGLNAVGCNIIGRNDGYNQVFFVSHSKRKRDVSKVVWRIINGML